MSSTRDARTKFARNAALFSVAVIAIIVAVAALMPLSQPRIPMNHTRAAHWTRHLVAAERQYAARFPAGGFTCNLQRLAEAGLIDKVLASGDKSGYRYELRNCGTSGKVAAFTMAAVPTKAGTTGVFAFCANEEGVVWYAEDGSADGCLQRQLKWTKTDPLQD